MNVQDRPVIRDRQEGFSGGLNTTGDSFNVGKNQVTRAVNARLTQFGSAMKRLGTQRVHSATLGGAVRGGFCWQRAASVEHLVVANGVFYSGGSSLSIPVTWTSKAMAAGAALSASTYISWAAFRDGSGEVVYLADGGALIKWDGVTLTRIVAGGTPASISRLAVYNQRLIGISGADQTVYYSALNDGDTLGITGSLGGSAVIRTFGDQKLTTLATLRDSLALFHVSGISRFVGLAQDDIAIATGVQGFSSDVGTLMPRSVVVVDGQAMFLSDRGVYSVSEEGVTPIDTPERPDPTASLLSALSSSDLAKVNGVHDRKNREIRWNIPGSGIYVFNYRLSAWTGPWDSIYTSTDTLVQWEALDSTGLNVVCFGSADGFVRQADLTGIYKDDVTSAGTGGSSFSFIVTCRRFFTQRPNHDKAFRWAYVFADLGNSITSNISWTVESGVFTYTIPNPGNSSSTWGSMTWGSFYWGVAGGHTFRIPLGGRGDYVDITISDDGEARSVYSRIELVAYDLGPRG